MKNETIPSIFKYLGLKKAPASIRDVVYKNKLKYTRINLNLQDKT